MLSIEEAKSHFISAVDKQAAYSDMVKAKALELGIEWIDNVEQMEEAIEDKYNDFFSSSLRCFSYFPTQEQIDAISIEPAKILSDEEWARDFYKNRQKCGNLPLDIGPYHPSVLLANFRAMKLQIVDDLRVVEELHPKPEEQKQSCDPNVEKS